MKLRMSIAKKRLSGLTMKGFRKGGVSTTVRMPKMKLPKMKRGYGA